MPKSPPLVPPAPRRRSRVWTSTPALLTCVYWLTLLLWGLIRLRRDGPEAAMPIVSGWYVAGLVFLGVWGVFAALAGILAGGRREPKLRRSFSGDAPILSVRKRS